MKIGDIIYAAVSKDGKILSTEEGEAIGESKYEVERTIKTWRLKPEKIAKLRLEEIE